LVSAFVMVSTVWSVYCLLFFYSRCPRAQQFVKVGGGHMPPVCAPRAHGVGATAHRYGHQCAFDDAVQWQRQTLEGEPAHDRIR